MEWKHGFLGFLVSTWRRALHTAMLQLKPKLKENYHVVISMRLRLHKVTSRAHNTVTLKPESNENYDRVILKRLDLHRTTSPPHSTITL